jgi:hypothetical protein
MLESASTYKRVKLWTEHTDPKLDQNQTEKEFRRRLNNNSNYVRTLEAAQAMLDLKNSSSQKLVAKQECILPVIPFNDSMLYSGRFSSYF